MPGDDQAAASEVEQAVEALNRAGWSIGDAAFAGETGERTWLVTGTNGKHAIRAEGPTEASAWRNAVEQARALGMIGRPEGR